MYGQVNKVTNVEIFNLLVVVKEKPLYHHFSH